jgi:EVE domain
MTIGRTPKGEDIAGWVLKGDPKVYDLDAELEARGVVRNWSVYGKTYRPELMAEGQRCFLWRSGPDGAIVAAGHVTGPVYEAQADVAEWIDQSKAVAADLFVPVELYELDEPIPRAALRDHPVLSQVEFLRAQSMSNPTILTPEELEALDDLVKDREPLSSLGIIGSHPNRFFVDRREADDRFVVLSESPNGEVSDHDDLLDALLAAASAAAAQIEAEPVVDWDDGGTLVVRLKLDDGRRIGLYKVEGGYEALEIHEDDTVEQVERRTKDLSDLLKSMF